MVSCSELLPHCGLPDGHGYGLGQARQPGRHKPTEGKRACLEEHQTS